MNKADKSFTQPNFPQLLRFQKGEQILGQGKLFQGYFLIKSGLVKTVRYQESGNSTLLSIKDQGEFLGEFHEEHTEKRLSYSAFAMEDNTLVEKIQMEEHPNLKLMRIIQTLQEEIHTARLRLERMLFQDAEFRIISVLKDLGERFGEKYGDETLLKLPLTHEELAKLTDTSRQTVTTILSGLKAQNKINYSRGRILFRNIHQLKTPNL
ncbi:Crp/Fnr family transcriptional regulator [Algoriphagus sp. NF]|jgi:CRP/FNR family transcriptional regulator|uniref:Crp/Fnr family transcriptional regulator n=1 Tax=Algoriphagus marincola TaxID=264027 RepID=A0ABS7N2F5_9BACT|nr:MULTISPECIES: Crp/Fnr family transcriptional regulator [Algoriphagus]MBY5950508.1 Crp/Fnr family transcriptional regulator [Algoriphagus marincola]MDE0559671.1 Crp/Fnr family transcriptional regulator [Algoriphagus sp. NF]